MQNPPPPPMIPPGQPPVGYGAAGMVPGHLASPGLRIVGGLIDAVVLGVIVLLIDAVSRGSHGLAGLLGLLVSLGYLGYFWNTRGQSLGMMVFGFRVRDYRTGQYPTVGQSLVRALVWWLELVTTPCCLIGFLGWGWQLWDSRYQALHDKAAATIVTTS